MNKNIIKYIHTYTLNILLCSLMFFLPIHLLIFKKDSGLTKKDEDEKTTRKCNYQNGRLISSRLKLREMIWQKKETFMAAGIIVRDNCKYIPNYFIS